MARFVLLNTRLFAGGVDLTTRNNKVELGVEVEEKDSTSFQPEGTGVWKEVLGGLKSLSLSASGQWEAGDPSKVDDETWADLGAVIPWSACPVGAAEGDLAWVISALRSEYKLGGAVGDVAPWDAKAGGNGALVRGTVAHPPGTARTVTGVGTAVNLGALSASQRLYASLHVLSVAGTTPSVTVRIESDDASGFLSPTTRHTFTAATAVGGQSAQITGAVTDTWWRPAWVISGTSPSFLMIVSWGIA